MIKLTEKTENLRIAVPSEGALYDSTMSFMKSAGLEIRRFNARSYEASINVIPNAIVHFQRSGDIPLKIEEASADIGIVGYDRYLETKKHPGSSSVIINNLGFGHAELVLGLPDTWVDIADIKDLANLALEFKNKGKSIKIATKYPVLVEKHLTKNSVFHFELVQSSGALEAAPSMGYADIIADISSTGTTMRENRLKTIAGGAVIKSQACIIANREMIINEKVKLDQCKLFLERIEAYLRSNKYFTLTANMTGKNPEQIASIISKGSITDGLKGPTISKVYNTSESDLYAVTMIISKDNLIKTVSSMRKIGAETISVYKLDYLFDCESDSIKTLLEKSET